MAGTIRFSLLAACVSSNASVAATRVGANPIRKVVNLIEKMQENVKKEGEKETELHHAAMCHCETQAGELKQSIADGKARIEAITAALKSGNEAAEQLKAQLAQHMASRETAKKAIATATAIREKEAAAFSAQNTETETNLAALKKAVTALERGMGGSFVQTGAANVLKQFAMDKADMADASRQELLVFLTGKQEEGEAAPSTGEITGILKQMGDQMQESLQEGQAAENDAIKSFQGLMAAKHKELETLQAQIEEEMMRVGEAGVGGAGGQNALDDAEEGVKDDTALLTALDKSCAEKTKDHEEAQKLLGEELLALADTIKMLTSDETLELFKKYLPGASSSFLQVTVSSKSMKARALSLLRSVPRAQITNRPEIDLIALAIQGKQKGFEEVLRMIDNMLATLKKEQSDDDSKKSYCLSEFDRVEDEKKQLDLSIMDSGTAIDDMKGKIEQMEQQIASLQKGIRTLDLDVEEATDQRKSENMEFKDLIAGNAAAKEVLTMARTRLAKFYKPTFVQAVRKQDGNGPIDMIDTIIKELDAESQEAQVVEKNTQQNFEEMIAAAGNKRKEDSTAVTDMESAKAEAMEALQAEANAQFGTRKELAANGEITMNLHKDCDWLLENYPARQEARTVEIEAIEKAKAVLNGADYSLIQTSHRRAIGRRLMR